MAGKMPPAFMPLVGIDVKNSGVSAGPPLINKKMIMPMTGATAIAAIRASTRCAIFSKTSCLRAPLTLLAFPVTVEHQIGDPVHREGDDEQDQTNGEQRKIV